MAIGRVADSFKIINNNPKTLDQLQTIQTKWVGKGGGVHFPRAIIVDLSWMVVSDRAHFHSST